MKNIVTGDVPLAHAGGRSTVTMSPISGHRHTEHVSERIGMALTYDNDLLIQQ